jgi:hypothetical protein
MNSASCFYSSVELKGGFILFFSNSLLNLSISCSEFIHAFEGESIFVHYNDNDAVYYNDTYNICFI